MKQAAAVLTVTLIILAAASMPAVSRDAVAGSTTTAESGVPVEVTNDVLEVAVAGGAPVEVHDTTWTHTVNGVVRGSDGEQTPRGVVNVQPIPRDVVLTQVLAGDPNSGVTLLIDGEVAARSMEDQPLIFQPGLRVDQFESVELKVYSGGVAIWSGYQLPAADYAP